jgi:hypothetical protein
MNEAVTILKGMERKELTRTAMGHSDLNEDWGAKDEAYTNPDA